MQGGGAKGLVRGMIRETNGQTAQTDRHVRVREIISREVEEGVDVERQAAHERVERSAGQWGGGLKRSGKGRGEETVRKFEVKLLGHV